MKKSIVYVVFVVILVTSCSQRIYNHNNEAKKDDIIRIWYYNYVDHIDEKLVIDTAMLEVGNFAKKNNIGIELTEYKSDELSYDDYILKRNVAVAGKAVDIVIDTAGSLYTIRNQCGDYKKISTYENIFENFKGKYCIPLFLYNMASFIDKTPFDEYNVKTDDVISYQEYYEIKQKMKEAGARFVLNKYEMMELEQYYITKNKAKIIENNGKYTIDNDIVKRTILDIYNDIKKYYEDIDEKKLENITDTEIRDEATGRIIRDLNKSYFFQITNYDTIIESIMYDKANISNYIFLMREIGRNDYTPSLFINKNTERKNVYNAASMLFSCSFYEKLRNNGLNFGPIIDTKETREFMSVDENWRYNGPEKFDFGGNADKKGVALFNECYELFRKGDTSILFTEKEYRELLPKFIHNEVIETMKNPSNIDNFEENADSFITNVNVKYN